MITVKCTCGLILDHYLEGTHCIKVHPCEDCLTRMVDMKINTGNPSTEAFEAVPADMADETQTLNDWHDRVLKTKRADKDRDVAGSATVTPSVTYDDMDPVMQKKRQ